MFLHFFFLFLHPVLSYHSFILFVSPVFFRQVFRFIVLFLHPLSFCSFDLFFPHVLSSCPFSLFFLPSSFVLFFFDYVPLPCSFSVCSSVLLSCSSFLICYPYLRSGLSSCSFILFFRFVLSFFSLFVLYFSSCPFYPYYFLLLPSRVGFDIPAYHSITVIDLMPALLAAQLSGNRVHRTHFLLPTCGMGISKKKFRKGVWDEVECEHSA
jgi:hypothetical protein